jgi:hypothetical protein
MGVSPGLLYQLGGAKRNVRFDIRAPKAIVTDDADLDHETGVCKHSATGHTHPLEKIDFI